MRDQNLCGAGRRSPTHVIDRIRDIEASGAPWSLGAAEIRELLGINNEDFYRRIYAAESGDHPLISLSAATGTYGQENIWEFVALIELFCGGETEIRLEQAGIFFSHSEQLEILGVFLAEAVVAIRRHNLNIEEFSAMLRTFGSYERARDVYLEEHFPLTGLIDRAAALYCGDRSFGIPELAETNVKRLLRFFFQKHVLEIRSIFAVLIEYLLQQAIAEGYAAEQADDRRKREQTGARSPGSLVGPAEGAPNDESGKKDPDPAAAESPVQAVDEDLSPGHQSQGLETLSGDHRGLFTPAHHAAGLFVDISTRVDFNDSHCFSFNIEQYAKLSEPQSVITFTSRPWFDISLRYLLDSFE